MYAENLKKIRQELGLSVAKLADKLEMSVNTITNYERGERTPNAILFTQMNKNLNINLNWFVSGNGNMFNSTEPSAANDELEQKVVEVMKKYGVIEK